MHQIVLKEWTKPDNEGQRRLNPNLIEVIKKEILKLLAEGLIYQQQTVNWLVQFS